VLAPWRQVRSPAPRPAAPLLTASSRKMSPAFRLLSAKCSDSIMSGKPQSRRILGEVTRKSGRLPPGDFRSTFSQRSSVPRKRWRRRCRLLPRATVELCSPSFLFPFGSHPLSVHSLFPFQLLFKHVLISAFYFYLLNTCQLQILPTTFNFFYYFLQNLEKSVN
jgi:hypothetical protein